MHIRTYDDADLPWLIDVTVDTFGPFYEGTFRPLVGETIFAHQHGSWRQDYLEMVPGLHDPAARKFVAIAVDGDDRLGYAGWNVDPARRHGEIEILAVSGAHRRSGVGTALCLHAFADMKARDVEVAAIGTGGDPFHAPARALYAALGCVELPVSVFFTEL